MGECVNVGTLDYWIRLKLPITQAIRLYQVSRKILHVHWASLAHEHSISKIKKLMYMYMDFHCTHPWMSIDYLLHVHCIGTYYVQYVYTTPIQKYVYMYMQFTYLGSYMYMYMYMYVVLFFHNSHNGMIPLGVFGIDCEAEFFSISFTCSYKYTVGRVLIANICKLQVYSYVTICKINVCIYCSNIMYVYGMELTFAIIRFTIGLTCLK